eukprot:TRINITY_DN1290_c0_g1_i3.p1 TRINITY_DN1290_c0_g1~~TRINITY_DN1290_c0_g1_i3.p1  ORF type:complete len:377 (-),score=72.49 TRINITY_DN1290_c0_g1_i3:86-1111(-)
MMHNGEDEFKTVLSDDKPCGICGKHFEPFIFLKHIGECLYEFNKGHGLDQPCFQCGSCKGGRPHPMNNNNNVSSSSKGKAKVSATPLKEAQRHIDLVMSEDSDKESDEDDPFKIGLEMGQANGRSCTLCGEWKSPSGVPIPFIYIGPYINLMLCKKIHLGAPNDFEAFFEILIRCFDAVKAGKVTKKTQTDLNESSDEEAQAQQGPAVGKCRAYSKSKGKVCEKECSILKIYDGEFIHFCKPKHALRYVAEYYCKRGGKIQHLQREKAPRKPRSSPKSNKKRNIKDYQSSDENDEVIYRTPTKSPRTGTRTSPRRSPATPPPKEKSHKGSGSSSSKKGSRK